MQWSLKKERKKRKSKRIVTDGQKHSKIHELTSLEEETIASHE